MPVEIADMDNMDMWLDVDGKGMQTGSTGTPSGVGMGQNPQQFLHGGEGVPFGIPSLVEQRSEVLPA